jgi:membrane fusion protein, multidrug efflux system
MNRFSRRHLMTLTAVALLTACARTPPPVSKTPVFVTLARAFEGPAVPALTATGLVMAKDEIRLSFKVGGVVRDLAVRPGDRVRQGQVLAQIEPGEIDAQVEQARQLADKAARDLARGEALHADQVISLEQLQNLRTQAEIARAQLRAAQFNRGYAAIVAPRDAIVLRRLAEPRELVPPGQPVLVLGAEDRGYVVRTGLSDRDVVGIRRGDAVDVRLDALPDVTLKAEVTEIAGAADERSGLFQVEALITDSGAMPGHALVTGMVARLALHPGARDAQRLVYVPTAAVLDAEGGKASVFVATTGVARRRAVEVAFIAPDGVALRSGLRAGEAVVATGAPYLDDGDPIRTP